MLNRLNYNFHVKSIGNLKLLKQDRDKNVLEKLGTEIDFFEY